MDDEGSVYRVLATGLLDIRIAAHDGNTKAAFALADLLHNIPYQLEHTRRLDGDFAEIIEGLKIRADQKNLTKWLEAALSSEK